MMQKSSVVVQRSPSHLSHRSRTETIQLQGGVVSLGIGPIAIRMIEGSGWITYNGKDIFVRPEQEIVFSKSHYPVLISSLRLKQRIVFEVNAL